MNLKQLSADFKKTARSDALASIVVFLVALPLCMGIAVASGAPAATGLITGIVGGIVVGVIAGSPLQVSGPAAGLTVIVAKVIYDHGIEMLGIVVLIAGLIQAILGLLRLGQVFRAVSPAVIHGMLAGIGVLIFASQFHVMVDDPKRGDGLENLMSIPEAVAKVANPVDGSPHQVAAAIGVLTIVVIVLWPLLAPKRIKAIPAPLVGIVVASAVALLFKLDQITYVNIPDQLSDQIRWPTWETLGAGLTVPILISGITVAAVASAETLLCASAVDQSQTFVRTKYDRELFAQGVGNSICGVLGALPMTGVIVRSSANVSAGARTRLSAILHGVWLLAFVSMLPEIIRAIPMAALGAMLVFIAYKLAHPRPIGELLKAGKGEVAIYLVTLFAIVGFDLLTGIIAGIVAATIKLLYTFSHLKVVVEKSSDRDRVVLHLEGAATFIRLPRLARVLERVPGSAELHIQMDELTYIDHACLELLHNWRRQHVATGGRLILDWDSLSAKSKRRLPMSEPIDPVTEERQADRSDDTKPVVGAV